MSDRETAYSPHDPSLRSSQHSGLNLERWPNARKDGRRQTSEPRFNSWPKALLSVGGSSGKADVCENDTIGKDMSSHIVADRVRID